MTRIFVARTLGLIWVAVALVDSTPAAAQAAHPGAGAPQFRTMITTRRFWERPSGVSLGATGEVLP